MQRCCSPIDVLLTSTLESVAYSLEVLEPSEQGRQAAAALRSGETGDANQMSFSQKSNLSLPIDTTNGAFGAGVVLLIAILSQRSFSLHVM